MQCEFCNSTEFETIKGKDKVRCKKCDKLYKINKERLIDTNKYMNKNGVLGIRIDSKTFIPECCLDCSKYNWETTYDGIGQTLYYCERELAFPVRKGNCKVKNKSKV